MDKKQEEIKEKNLLLLEKLIKEIKEDKFEGVIVFLGGGGTQIMSRRMRHIDHINLLSQVRDFFNDSNTGFNAKVSLDIIGTVPDFNETIDKGYIG